MSERHEVAFGSRIDAFDRKDGRWLLQGDTEGYQAVVVAVPAEQAAPLLAPHQPGFAALARATPSAPCWTAMAAFAERLPLGRDVVRTDGAIGWAARDGAKPGRGGTETWVIQGSPDWSRDHLQDEPAIVAPALLHLLAGHAGRALPAPTFLQAHRWRYAKTGAKAGPGALWDAGAGIGACGDWLLAPRVEAAWLSGQQVASLIEEGAE